jgi:hypothetical protein
MVWRGDGVAERAGLENRRWGNSSASSNLAPSAILTGEHHGFFACYRLFPPSLTHPVQLRTNLTITICYR